jgi:hypothetical protein
MLRAVAGIATGALLLTACTTGAARRPSGTAVSAPADSLVRAEAGTGALGSFGGPVGVVTTLGIPPFAVAGDTLFAPLGYALADLLTTDLARASRVRLVERGRLGEVLRELDLGTAGRVDAATTPRVGRLVRADRLVIGAVGAPPSGGAVRNAELRLDVRLADVGTGRISTAVSARAPAADVLTAEKALAFRLLEAMGVRPTPAERAAIEQRPTADFAALLAYGDGVRREYVGDFRGAVESFRRATRLDPGFRQAGERALRARALSEGATTAPVVVPGVRALDGAIAATIDRLNRPLEWVPTIPRTGTAADPGFPFTLSTLLVSVTRP